MSAESQRNFHRMSATLRYDTFAFANLYSKYFNLKFEFKNTKCNSWN